MKEYYLRQLNELTVQFRFAQIGLKQSIKDIIALLCEKEEFEDIKGLASRLNKEVEAVAAIEKNLDMARANYEEAARSESANS